MQTLQLHKDHSWQEHLVGISILLAFLLPHTSMLFQLVNPLLCLFLLYRFRKGRTWQPIVLFVLVPVILSILFNFQNASLKAFQSTFTILLYFACFPFVGQVHVRKFYLFFCLAYIFLSQIVYLLGMPRLTAFFDMVYPMSEENLDFYSHIQGNIGYSNVFAFRLGGIYHNPNQCARYLTMLMAFFLSVNHPKNVREVIYFILIAYVGVLLTGSRTGFIIASLIAYFGFLRHNRLSGFVRFTVVAIAFFGFFNILQGGTSLRALDIDSTGSANLKWSTFMYYIHTEKSTLSYLLGHLDISLFNGGVGRVMNNFDSEYGELIFRFGFIGFFCFLIFYWSVAKRLPKSQWFFFIILLWMVSSTIVASYRALFIFMLFLSVVYSNHYKSKDNS